MEKDKKQECKLLYDCEKCKLYKEEIKELEDSLEARKRLAQEKGKALYKVYENLSELSHKLKEIDEYVHSVLEDNDCV